MKRERVGAAPHHWSRTGGGRREALQRPALAHAHPRPTRPLPLAPSPSPPNCQEGREKAARARSALERVAAAQAKRRRKDAAALAKKMAPAAPASSDGDDDDPASDAFRYGAAGGAGRKAFAQAAAVEAKPNWSKFRSAAPGWLDFTVECECVTARHGGCTVKFMRPKAVPGHRALASSAADVARAIGAATSEAAKGRGRKASSVVTRVPVQRGSGLARRILVRFYDAVPDAADEPDITVVHVASEWSAAKAKQFFRAAAAAAAKAGKPHDWALELRFSPTGERTGKALVVEAELDAETNKLPAYWPDPAFHHRATVGQSSPPAAAVAAAESVAAHERLHARGFSSMSVDNRGPGDDAAAEAAPAGNHGAAGLRTAPEGPKLTLGPYHQAGATKQARKRWSQNLADMAASTYGAVRSTIGARLARAFEAVVATLAAVTGRADLATAAALSTHFRAQGARCPELIPAATMSLTLNVDVAPHLDCKDVCGTIIGWIAIHAQASGRAGARARSGATDSGRRLPPEAPQGRAQPPRFNALP
jgi:hypothetical protein